MKKPIVRIVHGYGVTPEVTLEMTLYASNDYIYLFFDKDADFMEWAKTNYQYEKEKNEWIRKYYRILKGLNYWKQRALNKKESV
jgi:hypothetical protein